MRKDVIQIGILETFFLTLSVYDSPKLAVRKLGKCRYAIDLGWISILFERY